MRVVPIAPHLNCANLLRSHRPLVARRDPKRAGPTPTDRSRLGERASCPITDALSGISQDETSVHQSTAAKMATGFEQRIRFSSGPKNTVGATENGPVGAWDRLNAFPTNLGQASSWFVGPIEETAKSLDIDDPVQQEEAGNDRGEKNDHIGNKIPPTSRKIGAIWSHIN